MHVPLITHLKIRLSEAEFVLTGDSSSKTKGLEEFVSEYGDIASFAISLLADIYRLVDIAQPLADADSIAKLCVFYASN